MILEVQHETCFDYTEAVTESSTEVRMEPVSDADQTCHSFHLAVSPSAPVFRYQDGFGNYVHHFNLLGAHQQVRTLAASLVETHPRRSGLGASRATLPFDQDWASLDGLDYLKLRGPAHASPRLAPLLDELRPRDGMPAAEFIARVARHIHTRFEYAPAVTLASSPIDDVLEKGKGVCQDFAHLMIAVLRSFGVPARYVSGYIHRPGKESQSHAWCEAWLPDLGWVGFDPTNDRPADDHFVKVAIGRDFTDVPPNKGVYRGAARETISVRVETRLLDRLPSLAWRDQLPALEVPLTAILSRGRGPGGIEEEAQQQQQ